MAHLNQHQLELDQTMNNISYDEFCELYKEFGNDSGNKGKVARMRRFAMELRKCGANINTSVILHRNGHESPHNARPAY